MLVEASRAVNGTTGQDRRPGQQSHPTPVTEGGCHQLSPWERVPLEAHRSGAPRPRDQIVQGQLMVQGKSKYSSSPMISAKCTRISRL